MVKATSSSDKNIDIDFDVDTSKTTTDPLLGRKCITTTQRKDDDGVDVIGETRRRPHRPHRPHRDGHTHPLPPTTTDEEIMKKANNEEYHEFYNGNNNTVIMHDILEQFEVSMNQQLTEFTEYINDGCSLNESQGIAAVIVSGGGIRTPTSTLTKKQHNYDYYGSGGRGRGSSGHDGGQVVQNNDNDDDDGILSFVSSNNSKASSAIETITDLHTIWNNNTRNIRRPPITMSSPSPKQQQQQQSLSKSSTSLAKAAANIDEQLQHPSNNILHDRSIIKREEKDEYKRLDDTTPAPDLAATATAAAAAAAETADNLHNKNLVRLSQTKQKQQRVVMDFRQHAFVADGDNYYYNNDEIRRSSHYHNMKSSSSLPQQQPPLHTIDGNTFTYTNLNNDTDSIISAISEFSTNNPSSIHYLEDRHHHHQQQQHRGRDDGRRCFPTPTTSCHNNKFCSLPPPDGKRYKVNNIYCPTRRRPSPRHDIINENDNNKGSSSLQSHPTSKSSNFVNPWKHDPYYDPSIGRREPESNDISLATSESGNGDDDCCIILPPSRGMVGCLVHKVENIIQKYVIAKNEPALFMIPPGGEQQQQQQQLQVYETELAEFRSL